MTLSAPDVPPVALALGAEPEAEAALLAEPVVTAPLVEPEAEAAAVEEETGEVDETGGGVEAETPAEVPRARAAALAA